MGLNLFNAQDFLNVNEQNFIECITMTINVDIILVFKKVILCIFMILCC